MKAIVSSMGTVRITKDAKCFHADNEYSDQTARMRRLIWVFVGRTLLTLRLLCSPRIVMIIVKSSVNPSALYIILKYHTFNWNTYQQNQLFAVHYENTPIQIYRKSHLQKLKNFWQKILIFFLIFAQNIDCGYSLEPPRWGGSNEYPQSMFLS